MYAICYAIYHVCVLGRFQEWGEPLQVNGMSKTPWNR